MSKRIKELMVQELKAELEASDSCVLVGIGALSVMSANELRSDLRAAGVRFRVLKNRLAARTFEEIGWGGVADHLEGSCAIAHGEGGALTASKCLVGWEKKLPKAIVIRGGYLEGKVLDQEAARRLATIPDRPTLYAMLAAVVVAPMGQVASLINEVLAGVARAVGAVAEQRQE